jgi:hypothetical protein
VTSAAGPPYDPYGVLGLSRDATPGQVIVRRKKLLAQVHPDRANQQNADELRAANVESAEINRAGETLLNPAKRREVDDDLAAWSLEARKELPSERPRRGARRGSRDFDEDVWKWPDVDSAPAPRRWASARPDTRRPASAPWAPPPAPFGRRAGTFLVQANRGQWVAFIGFAVLIVGLAGLRTTTLALILVFLVGQAVVAGRWRGTPVAAIWRTLRRSVAQLLRMVWRMIRG